MLHHLLNLIIRSIEAVPAAVGSNWLGVLYPLLLFVITEGLSVMFFGWPAVKSNWGKTVAIGFAVVGVFWTGLFLWCAIKTTFTDHQQLTGRVAELHQKLIDTKSEGDSHLSQVSQDLNGQISQLRQDCAYKQGQNTTLQNQNRDQQTLIAGCQEDAIKRLAPEPRHLTPVFFDSQGLPNSMRRARFLMLTNKPISPIRALVTCNKVLTSGEASIVGTGGSMGAVILRPPYALSVDIDSPSWTPISPLLVDVSYPSQEGDIGCMIMAR